MNVKYKVPEYIIQIAVGILIATSAWTMKDRLAIEKWKSEVQITLATLSQVPETIRKIEISQAENRVSSINSSRDIEKIALVVDRIDGKMVKIAEDVASLKGKP